MTPILATKLYLPQLRPNVVSRPRLIERLNKGLHRKLTLISAPAGFGKTTLVSAWIADFRLQIVDYKDPNLQSTIYNLKSAIKKPAPQNQGRGTVYPAVPPRLAPEGARLMRCNRSPPPR